MTRSRATWTPTRRRSWRTLRSRGGADALGGTISEPAWRNKPSWYLLTTEDRMIPPPAQQMMSQRAGSTVEEVAASHSVFVSQPAVVAAIIEKAASAT